MRTFLVALLLGSTLAAGQDAPKPLSIAVEPLGDREGSVVARVFFRFANPRAITDAGLFLEGSFLQAGQVPRNFRFAVPRKGDKMIWQNRIERNGRMVARTRWAVLPDQRNEMAMVHMFAEGETEIDARLVLEGDRGNPPLLIAKATETVTLAKTNRPLAADAGEEEPAVREEEKEEPEAAGAVTIRIPHGTVPSHLFPVRVDVLPPVKRVEFWVEEKKILARNAPPYAAELDLGDQEAHVALRAIGFDAAGRYVDADAFVVNESGTQVGVKLTRVVSSDGFTHFKLSVRNPKGLRLERVALYAGDRMLHEWAGPPFAVSVSTASLAGADFVRASVIDETGSEASDRQLLRPAGK